MRKVLWHEFRHHVEGRAGVRDLEVWTRSRSPYISENSRQKMSKENHPERNLSFWWLGLSRNYSFVDKQERTAGSQVVRKFLPMVETFFLQKCKKPDTCWSFLRICTANLFSDTSRGSVSIAKTDFIDRWNHPERNLSFGWFQLYLEQQKAFVLEPPELRRSSVFSSVARMGAGGCRRSGWTAAGSRTAESSR